MNRRSLLGGRVGQILALLSRLLPHIDGRIELADDFPSDDLLDHVLQGDDAGETALFVGDRKERLAPLDKFLEQLAGPRRLGHRVDWPLHLG